MVEKKRDHHSEDEVEATDDVIEDDPDLADVEAASAQKLKKLRTKLKECEVEKAEHQDALQRTRADFLNTRKRLEEQLKRDTERITEKHIIELLPLADSFDIAMQSPGWEDCDETWRKGIEGIYAQLQQILKRHDVVAINETAVPFDPHLHEAVANEPVTDAKDADTIVRILQPGYRMGERVIRHARVAVGHKE